MTEAVEERAPTIVEALAQVARDVPAVPKSERNDHQRFMFRGIDSVVNAVGPALRRARVLVVPELLNLERTPVTTGRGSAMTATVVTVRYRFHGPAGDYLDAVVPGEAFDSGDKGTAKAMSVAFRTALLQALTLPTDEADPDADSPQGVIHPQPQPQPQAAQAPPQAQAQAQASAAMERALADQWNNPDGLARLHSWATSNGAPPDFLARVQARAHHLTKENPT